MNVTAQDPRTGRAQLAGDRHRRTVRAAMRDAVEPLTRRAADIRAVLLITMIVAANVLGGLVLKALELGNERLALWAGFPAFACFFIVMWLAATEPTTREETEKGEIAKMSNEEFDHLVEEVESSASAEPASPLADGDHFEQVVRDALDELPDFLRASLDDNVAVLVSDDGAEHNHYGLYQGGTMARGIWRHTILIYRDTLVRDFGHDPEALRRNVSITVRHEVAHHLGASESRVAELGL